MKTFQDYLEATKRVRTEPYGGGLERFKGKKSDKDVVDKRGLPDWAYYDSALEKKGLLEEEKYEILFKYLYDQEIGLSKLIGKKKGEIYDRLYEKNDDLKKLVITYRAEFGFDFSSELRTLQENNVDISFLKKHI